MRSRRPQAAAATMAALAAAAALVLLLAVGGADAARSLSSSSPAAAPESSSDWVEGRATWYEDNKQGACQYKDNIPKYYAAMSDSNAPADGVAYASCGSCYAVQCIPGTVVDRYGELLSRWDSCKGPAAGKDREPNTVIVSISDVCPCYHTNYASNQRWCCGDVPHIDLGAEAFGRLADKGQGVVRVRWRRVDCSLGNGPVAASKVQ